MTYDMVPLCVCAPMVPLCVCAPMVPLCVCAPMVALCVCAPMVAIANINYYYHTKTTGVIMVFIIMQRTCTTYKYLKIIIS